MNLERLEPRDVPASIATYTDVDGDRVSLTLSDGAMNVAYAAIGQGVVPRMVDVRGATSGADLTMKIARAPGGDGRANVGQINAEGVDLGRVAINGDLAQILVGDSDTDTPALKALTVDSIGRSAKDTLDPSGYPDSAIRGSLGKLTVRGDIDGAIVRRVGAGHFGSVTIGGSLIGRPNGRGGEISAGSFGSIRIGGSIEGGDTGGIYSSGDIASIRIGGSLVGGNSPYSGVIESGGRIGSVAIGGNIKGSDTLPAGMFYVESGVIHAKRIGSVTVGGSLISGSANAGAGVTVRSGAIAADDDIGTINVKGSLVGNPTNKVLISARGQDSPTATKDLAIGSITVGGRVQHALITAGFDYNGVGVNGNAQIGRIRVGGDWIAGSVTSGVNSVDFHFGDGNDSAIAGGAISRIGSIDIRGQVFGWAGSPGDSYGFVAQHIGSFKVAGASLALRSGSGNDTFALGSAHAVGSSQSIHNPDGFAVHVLEV